MPLWTRPFIIRFIFIWTFAFVVCEFVLGAFFLSSIFIFIASSFTPGALCANKELFHVLSVVVGFVFSIILTWNSPLATWCVNYLRIYAFMWNGAGVRVYVWVFFRVGASIEVKFLYVHLASIILKWMNRSAHPILFRWHKEYRLKAKPHRNLYATNFVLCAKQILPIVRMDYKMRAHIL